MADLWENDSVFEGNQLYQLGCSPLPTLIYPLPPAEVTQKASKVNYVHGDPLGNCRDNLPFDPNEKDLNWSQNSIGGPINTLYRSLSESPEGKKMTQRRDKSATEMSPAHHSGDNSTASSLTPGKSMMVTDIDEAMAHMDQKYLKSLFGEAEAATESPATNSIMYTSACDEDEAEETNIDDDLPSARIIANLRQKSFEAELSHQLSRTPKSHTSECRKRKSSIECSFSNSTCDAAVKCPADVPKRLHVKECQNFYGGVLVNWLCSTFDETHYLSPVLAGRDFEIIAAQFCTHLLSAGVLTEFGSKHGGHVFKAQSQYGWTKQESAATPALCDDQSVSALQISPIRNEDNTNDPKRQELLGLAAGYQENISLIKKETIELEERLKKDYEQEISRMRENFADQISLLNKQVQDLQNECLQYRTALKAEHVTREVSKTGDSAHMEASFRNILNSTTNGTEVPHQHHFVQGDEVMQHSLTNASLINGSHLASSEGYDPLSSVPAAHTTPQPTSSIPPNERSKPPPPPPPPPPPSVPECPPPPPGLLGPPPPPSLGGPPPPPPPGDPTLLHKRESSKPIVNPKSPMKPLFWKRIQVNSVPAGSVGGGGRNVFWEEIAEEPINFQNFEELFAKVPVEPKKRVTASKTKPKTIQPAKVIQPKRSQAVGILLSSLRLEFSDIEEAILNLETSILDIEKFKAIYDNRSDADEMKLIKSHLEKHSDIPLDKPEQFLYDLEQIPFVTDRIFCFIFQSSFQESIATIDCKLNNVKMTCQTLSSCESVKHIFGLILACGNYMNGGSRTRGQADGFDLEILPKLKDVKAKDNRTSLLQFVVLRYVYQYDTDVIGTDRAKLPLPDPSDIQQAGLVNFEDIEKELKRIHRDFNSAEEKAKAIIQSSTADSLEPFNSVMTSFFDKGRKDLNEQEETLAECSKIFQSTCEFFCVKPKNNEHNVTPEQFFSLWVSFCSDFKVIWKKEQQIVMKIRIKEAEERVRTIKESKLALPPTRAKKVGGLKDKLTRHGKL